MPSSSDLTYKHPIVSDVRCEAKAYASLVFELGGELSAASLGEGAGLVVGRAEPADVRIDDKSLSRSHARFSLRGGLVRVEDLASTNGVCIEGQRLEEALLEEGDSVWLGAVKVTVAGLVGRASLPQVRGLGGFQEGVLAEIERAHLFCRAFSLLALHAPRAPQVLGRVPSRLRSIDLFTLSTPDLALVLLPETPGTHALDLGRRLVASESSELACAVVSYPDDGTSADALLERAIHHARRLDPGATARARQVAGARRDAPVIVSEPMRALYGLIDRVARTTLPILVLGETGVGKELVSRAIHERSDRQKGPFIALNCASIPEQLSESALFGHERGAFTGASERRAGVFEQAHGGSVFLDEVGELSPAIQASLLRVLETRVVTRVGSTKEHRVDVRIIAATHRSLSDMVSAGTFRQDLLFRLDALTLRVPALRERVEEIEPLARRFLADARAHWGASPVDIGPEALAALRAFAWPGNIRQLKNAIERAAVVCPGAVIGLEDLPEPLLEVLPEAPMPAPLPTPLAPSPAATPTLGVSSEGDAEASLEARVRAFEWRLIEEALTLHGGSHTKAAAALGLPRRTLSNKIASLRQRAQR